jgi:protein with von Willebrand factor-like domain
MNSKHRAELQRKLSLNAVPRPPAGLVERIKADIPQYLRPEPERARFRRVFTGFNLRLAASVLLVITTAVVTVNVMTPKTEDQLAVTSTAAAPNVAPSAKMAQAAQAATEEVRVDIQQSTAVQIAEVDPGAQPPASRMAPPPASIPMPRQIAELAGKDRADAPDEWIRDGLNVTSETGGVAGGVVGGSPGGVIVGTEGARERERDAVAKRAEGRAAAPTAAAPAPPPAARREEVITVTAEAPMVQPSRTASASYGFVNEAYAADLELKQQENIFGISVDPGVFNRIKAEIESGHRPAANAVDVEALVNYFAGAPEKAPKRGLRLEVEASPAVVGADGENAVLRFTIDTPMKKLAANASTPPVATNVRLTVDVNRDVVANVERIGDSEAFAAESVLHYNLSVTGLYAIELKKGLRSTARVATVRLEYTSVDDGKPHMLEKVVHGNDLTKTWTRASRRHRLASLGAMWGESLKGAATGVDVARRAGELANQDPRDARARELANAASAIPGER